MVRGQLRWGGFLVSLSQVSIRFRNLNISRHLSVIQTALSSKPPPILVKSYINAEIIGWECWASLSILMAKADLDKNTRGSKPSNSYSVTTKYLFFFKKVVWRHYSRFQMFFLVISPLQTEELWWHTKLPFLTTAQCPLARTRMHLHENTQRACVSNHPWRNTLVLGGVNDFLGEERTDWEQISVVLFFNIWFVLKPVWLAAIGSDEGVVLFGEGPLIFFFWQNRPQL